MVVRNAIYDAFFRPDSNFLRQSSLESRSEKKMSANLSEAAASGNLEEVVMRLNLGEDVNQKLFPRFSTPLHDAVICGRVDVVRVLLERGADVNMCDYRGLTPLKVALRYGQDEIEAMLVARGAQLEIATSTCASEAANEDVPPPWKVTSASKARMRKIGKS